MISINLLFTRIAALFGSKADLYRLGVYYYQGRYGEPNFKKAEECFKKAVDKRYTKALYYLGLMYRDGSGVPQDFPLAIRYLELSRSVEPHAKESIEALEERLLAHDTTLLSAEELFKIGYMYANDNTVGRDYERALAYYRVAAERGDAAAETQLGQIYLYGRLGVERSYDNGIPLLYSAFQKGYTPARLTLLNLYADKEDRAQLIIAAEEGDQNAKTILALLYLTDAEELSKLKEEAITLLNEAAKEGHPVAKATLNTLDKSATK